jgi:hypothetical protein
VAAMIEPVSVTLPSRLDDFDGRQRQLAAEGVENAVPTEYSVRAGVTGGIR